MAASPNRACREPWLRLPPQHTAPVARAGTAAEVRELFEAFDDDGNGEVDVDEFRSGIKQFLGIQNEKLQAGGCVKESMHHHKPDPAGAKDPSSASDIVLVYTDKGEHMIEQLAARFTDAKQVVHVQNQKDCSGLPQLESQIFGAQLGVVIFVADDLKASVVPFAMRCVIKYKKPFTLVHAAELCRFDEVMPDDSFNDVYAHPLTPSSTHTP